MPTKKPNDNPIHAALRRVFGFGSFRPNQEEVVRAILAGRDVLAIMPTGGGKSLCFQFPSVMLDGVCVVVSPLLSLMKDQVDSAREMGIRAATLNSTTPKSEASDTYRALHAGQLDLLYVSPERFNSPGFLSFLTDINISFFAIDEAHCISEWGHQFRPDYLQLSQIREVFPNIPIAAFTATATEKVSSDILCLLGMRDPFCVRASFDRPNLSYQVLYKEGLLDQLTAFLRQEEDQPGIIYCGTRKKTEDTANRLCAAGFDARPYHAGMSDAERAAVQDAFSLDQTRIIVATIAFGMGIDKSNVRFVVHTDLPKNIEGYYQETGRAGRDGAPARCVLFFGYQDVILQKSFLKQYEDEHARLIAERQLQEMLRYAEADQCRRRALLHYFGEEYPRDNCGNCDFCNDQIHRVDATIDAQKALSAMARTQNRFGAGHLIDILVGKKTPLVEKCHHHLLPTFGVGRDSSIAYWRVLFNAMISRGAAEIDPNARFPIPRMTALGREIMLGHEPFEMIHFPKLRKGMTVKRAAGGAAAEMSPSDHNLFEELRQLRLRLAQRRHIPPYQVFTDKTLLELAARRPTNSDEMLGITGVGQKKMETYGEAFLELINRYPGA
ncbi:MAG: DNA helicase RecQ [Thermoguttaceae bacterium]|nr:DNA helicase RecQ [Thermoguttaceae bacterium]